MPETGDHRPPPADELRALPDAVGRFWTDAEARLQALQSLVQALDQDEHALADAVRRVDDAVVAGLQALGLPRGPVRAVQIERAPQPWAGRKARDCTVHLTERSLRDHLTRDRPDEIVRTWVHESLHARRLYAPGHASEYRTTPGYEEGLAEGLARYALQDRAGIATTSRSYEYYVTAYRALADALQIDADLLWRALWLLAPGEVRARFPSVVGELGVRQGFRSSTPLRLARLGGMGDTVFGASRRERVPDTLELMRLWRLVLG